MIIKETIWFTTHFGETIGVVLGEDNVTKVKKAYMGIGDGKDPEFDEKKILEWGTRIDPATAKRLSDHLNS